MNFAQFILLISLPDDYCARSAQVLDWPKNNQKESLLYYIYNDLFLPVKCQAICHIRCWDILTLLSTSVLFLKRFCLILDFAWSFGKNYIWINCMLLCTNNNMIYFWEDLFIFHNMHDLFKKIFFLWKIYFVQELLYNGLFVKT